MSARLAAETQRSPEAGALHEQRISKGVQAQQADRETRDIEPSARRDVTALGVHSREAREVPAVS